MRLGISSYTYTWACGIPGSPPESPMTAIGLGEQALALGVTVVQLCENIAVSRADLATLLTMGLQVEIGTRGLTADRLLQAAALAAEAGSTFVRVVIDHDGQEPTPAETIQLLRTLLPRLPRDIVIGLENHDRFSSATLISIIGAVGAERVGITLDTVNSFGALEGPQIVVETLAPHVVSLHLKDFKVLRVPSQMGFVIEGCPAGEGRLDIPWLLDSVRRAGRNPNAILELWTPQGPSLAESIARESAWAKKSIVNLRPLLPL